MSWTITGTQKNNWTPADITTALWLDAADASTITEISGAVSQWDDKSGNSRNATQSTAGSRPAYSAAGLNGRNVVTFDGSDDWLGLAASVFSNQLSFSWYAVAARTSSATQAIFTERVDNDTAMVACIAVDTTAILNRAGGTSSTAIIEQTESVSFPTNAAQLLESVQEPTSGAAFRNGASVATNSATKASLAFRRLVIGGSHANNTNIDPTQQFLAGYVAEIIISLSAHSTDTRQKIEGYLAHKWGLTANLPADHPYKTALPVP